MATHWWTLVPVVLHWGLTLAVVTRVIKRQRPVGVSLAWLAIAFWIPVVGAIIYFVLGERRTDPDRHKIVQAAEKSMRAWQRTLHEDCSSRGFSTISRYVQKASGFPPVSARGLTLYSDYKDAFAELILRIDGAQKSCHLSFYIWNEGGLAQDVAASLIGAAHRGVHCLVLVDALGSAAFLKGRTAKEMRNAGVQVAAAMPLRFLRSRWDLRNHRKIAVIDGKVAYTGSQNLVDPRFFKQGEGVGQWVDALVRVEGGVVSCLDAVFHRDWSVETRAPFLAPDSVADAVDCSIQVLPSGPEAGGDAIQQVLLMALYSAQETVTITTPYFVPDDSLLHGLMATAKRGVEVTLIVPKKNDSRLVTYASASTYEALLQAGVKIAQFRDGLLHTKSVVVDECFSIFGSVNFDMRSLWLDSEISLLVEDKTFASSLANLHSTYLEACDVLDEQTWRTRPRRTVLLERVARLTSPLL